MTKNWLAVVKSFLVLYISIQEEKKILEEMKRKDNLVVGVDAETAELVRYLLLARLGPAVILRLDVFY